MSTIIFKQSDLVNKNQKRIMFYILIYAPISLILMSVLIVKLPFLYLAGAVIIIELMIYFQFKIMTGKNNELLLEITDKAINRKSGKFSESILLSEISKIKITKNKNDEISCIYLFKGSKKVGLCSYKQMSELYEILISKLPDIRIEYKTIKVHISNFPLFIIFSSLVILGSILYVMNHSYSLYNFVRNIFYALIGMSLLFLKPISTYASRKYRLFEIIFGLFFMLDGIISLFYNWRT